MYGFSICWWRYDSVETAPWIRITGQVTTVWRLSNIKQSVIECVGYVKWRRKSCTTWKCPSTYVIACRFGYYKVSSVDERVINSTIWIWTWITEWSNRHWSVHRHVYFRISFIIIDTKIQFIRSGIGCLCRSPEVIFINCVLEIIKVYSIRYAVRIHTNIYFIVLRISWPNSTWDICVMIIVLFNENVNVMVSWRSCIISREVTSKILSHTNV